MKKIKILALCGESGSGKDTFMQEVLKLRPDLHEIVSCTTRPIREGEIHGVNYFYYSVEEFLNKCVHNEMLESTMFNNWYYGTSKDSVVEDAINIGVFNPAGIQTLLANPEVELKIVYVRRPAKLRLMGQLTREENPNVSEIIRRAAADEKDFAVLPFEYTLIENEIYDDLVMGPQRIVELLDEFN